MRRCLLFALIWLLLPAVCCASRGISLDIKQPGGAVESIPLYKGSHALLVGVADYTNGWPDLPSIPGEMNDLERALNEKGFNVVKVINPDSRTLANSFEDFVDKYGFDPENRLLFFFSGHGYSRTEVGKGYIVPADAPSPLADKLGFARKAIEMGQVLTWARRIESKHAMFLFDSCFSGTVFQSRALPKEPPHISAMVARPIRQFISAGSAGEEVPSRSYFVPSFIRALEGEGDLDRDGYITGTELGIYLNRKVSGYQVGQTPQYGKIRDPRLDQGDFVMVAGLTTYSDVRGSATPESGVLVINAAPAGATIFVAGIMKGAAPLSLPEVAAGRILVRVEKDGYAAKEETVLVRPGRKVELNFNLDKLVIAGSIAVSSQPSGAKWYLDGAYVGNTPDTMGNLEPKSYEVTVKYQGYVDTVKKVRVAQGQDVRVDVQLQEEAKIAQPAPAPSSRSGRVIESLNSGGYTYVYVDSGNEKFWAAAPEFAVKAGDRVIVPEGMPMENYKSRILNREFAVIYFVDAIAPDQRPALLTIEEVFAAREKLHGRQVSVKGTVVKFSAEVLGKNWIHLQDGTGVPGTNDLTITTKASAVVGESILVRGTATADKDFGYGYKYAVILEDADVQFAPDRIAGQSANHAELVALGNKYFDNGQSLKAIEAYANALALEPNDASTLADQGVMFRQQKWFSMAATNFEKAIEINPGFLQAYYNLGIVYYYDLNNMAKAREAWTKYLELSPTGKAADQIRQQLSSM